MKPHSSLFLASSASGPEAASLADPADTDPTPGWRRLVARIAVGLCAAWAAGCAQGPTAPVAPQPLPRVWILGEQHDQADHQRQLADLVRQLAWRREIGALVIEMAERGRDTKAMPPGSDEADVQLALGWDTRAWPWVAYGPAVMAAVRANVVVVGGNLPQSAVRKTANDASFDAKVAEPARERILNAVREGHCGALPPQREPGMLRVQVARDAAMAEAVAEALAEVPDGRIVLLHTGAQHASRDRGVPLHLVGSGKVEAGQIHVTAFGDAAQAAGLEFDSLRDAKPSPRPDYCAGLAHKLAPKPAN